MMGRVSQPPLRRRPVQRRSADRLARILDACAALLDESGYEQLSTRAVAERAGVPIGSVYRFFGNKRALVVALGHRNLDAYADRVSRHLAAAFGEDPSAAVDVMLDEYVEMKRTCPGFTLVDFGAQLPVGAPVDGVHHEVAGRLGELLASHLGREPDTELHRAVLVCVEAADALLQLAFRSRSGGDEAIIEETRRLLHAYLSTVLDASGPRENRA
jgi:AcrR family transcriptional regulator